MRLWSLHPRYLDAAGLVAVWREGLLAQAVLRGRTAGYRHHPQLDRFRAQRSPAGQIANFLRAVLAEADARGYKFAANKIGRARARRRINVTRGQVEFEWRHLLSKLRKRDPKRFGQLAKVQQPDVHPMFRVVPGKVEPWERNGSEK